MVRDIDLPPWLSRSTPILLLMTIFLVVGLVIGGDFGMSWDEDGNAEVGEGALRSYLSIHGYRDYLGHGEPLAHHGPAHFMLFSAASRLLSRVFPAGHPADGRHLTTYLVFLVGAAAFYCLLRRFLARRYAWMTTALFLCQPLLFGHAFINQKDTPFLASFILCVVTGMTAVDQLTHIRPGSQEPAGGMSDWIKRDWAATSRRWRLAAVLGVLLVMAAIVDALLLEQSLSWAKDLVRQAYTNEAWQPVNQAFRFVAQDAYKTPVEEYLARTEWAYGLFGRMGVLLLALFAGGLLTARITPTLVRQTWYGDRVALLLFLLAGGVLGWTVAIRPIGALAGLLVSGYSLHRLRGRTVLPLLAYWAAAGVVAYMAWPFLWDKPLERILQSMKFTGNIRGSTLYRGETVLSDSLPWHYFPTLAAVELTEPVALLFLAGMVAVGLRLKHHSIDRSALAVVGAWFGIPLLGLALGMGVSDNLRQLHFVLPPVFVVAGIGLALLLERIRSGWLQFALFNLLLAPGLIGLVQLHPYEYAYFNSYVGGTSAAQGQYELEYWCTSYREAMDQVNSLAMPGDKVMALGIDRAARPFAREDITVIENRYLPVSPEADFLLTCRHWLGFSDPGFERVFTVERHSALFAEVFRRKPLPAPDE